MIESPLLPPAGSDIKTVELDQRQIEKTKAGILPTTERRKRFDRIKQQLIDTGASPAEIEKKMGT